MTYSHPSKLFLSYSVLVWSLASIPTLANPIAPPLLLSNSTQAGNLDFSDVGRPRRRQGGGSRGSCLIANQPPLTALVPTSSTGYTLAQSPSFWFYQPYRLSEGHSIEFVLKDSQDNLVHSQAIEGSDTATGIINLRLPDSVMLDTSQSYEWYLLVQCDATNSERFVFVNGAIRRLERPELQQRLTALTPIAQINLYGAENIWYDAVDAAATQMQDTPENPDTHTTWTQLLDKINLSDLAKEPLVECCTPSP
jgi:Domain of Unknown Function (DUF928)